MPNTADGLRSAGVRVLDLPDVTLFCADTVAHDLTVAALDDCLRHVRFGDVKLFSDRTLGRDEVRIEKFASSAEMTRFVNYEMPRYIKTSHVLYFQWDGWIVDPSQWTDEFLRYDYIGAPWWYGDGYNVGNSGFCLRSKALIDFLAAHPDEFPPGSPEDEVLCRHYRRALPQFRWADEDLAWRFAFERTVRNPVFWEADIWPFPVVPSAFGFHGAFNWPLVLTKDECERRVAMMPEYARQKPEYQELMWLMSHKWGRGQ